MLAAHPRRKRAARTHRHIACTEGNQAHRSATAWRSTITTFIRLIERKYRTSERPRADDADPTQSSPRFRFSACLDDHTREWDLLPGITSLRVARTSSVQP